MNTETSFQKPPVHDLTKLDVLSRSQAPLRYMERVLGLRLTVAQQFQKMQYFLHKAIKGELEGKWNRADFFFAQAYNLLDKIKKNNQGLRQFLHENGFEATPEIIIGQIVEHWFLPNHLGFIKNLERDSRSAASRKRLKEHTIMSLDLVGKHLPEAKPLLFDLHKRLILNAEAREDFYEMEECAGQAIKAGIEETYFRGLQAKASYRQVLERIKGVDPKSTVNTLKQGVQTFEQWYRGMPHDLNIQRMLADLHLRLCIAQSHAQSFSDALLSFEKSAVLDPYLPGLDTIRKDLHQSIINLQHQVSQVMVEINKGGKQLTAEGQLMVLQSKRGFTPSNEFINSSKRVEMAELHDTAQIINLWHRVNRGKNRDVEHLPDLARSLDTALEDLLAMPDLSPQKLQGCWKIASAPFPDLVIVDPSDIFYFVRAIRFEPNTLDSSVPDLAYKTDFFNRDAPALNGVSEKKRSEAPFDYWLFSRQDWMPKAIVACGLLLCFYAYGSAWNEQRKLTARDEAFTSLMLHKNPLPFGEIERQAKRFLDNLPNGAADNRLKLVREAYSNAFLSWSATSEAQNTEELNRHLSTLKNLVSK